MTASGAFLEGLPPELRVALAAEIDPGEELRWCGRPDADRVVRTLLLGAVAFGIIAGLFGSMALFAAWQAWSELRDAASGSAQAVAVGVWMAPFLLGAIGGAACAAGFVGAPRMLAGARRRAEKTVYAVTCTRVLSVQLGRHGVPRVTSVEPAHPLVLVRTDTRHGRGDIHLYPDRTRQHQQGAVSFIGVDNAREVERLIRSTFDPPAR